MQVNRLSFLQLMSLVRPALVSRPYVPSLAYVLSAKGWLTTYNESIAIAVAVTDGIPDFNCCVEGERLHAALNQFTAADLDIKLADGALTLKSGKSTIKLGVLPAEDFLFDQPDWDGVEFKLTTEFLAGIVACLVAVGKNEALPAAMGVTMSPDGVDDITLYSTDNNTITQYQTDIRAQYMPGSAIVLPIDFCDQMVALQRATKCKDIALLITKTHVMADFGNLILTGRLQSEYDVIDYATKINGLCPLETIAAGALRIPDGFDGALARAMLALGNAPEATVALECADGVLKLDASTSTSSSHDELPFDEWVGDRLKFKVDPSLVARGVKMCDSLLPLPGVLVLLGGRGRLTHLVAHVAR